MRKREVETHRRTIRAAEFKQTLEEKERVKYEEKIKDFEYERLQVQRAIRETEEIKRKEEDKRAQLRL
jgi:hypothetical protein